MKRRACSSSSTRSSVIQAGRGMLRTSIMGESPGLECRARRDGARGPVSPLYDRSRQPVSTDCRLQIIATEVRTMGRPIPAGWMVLTLAVCLHGSGAAAQPVPPAPPALYVADFELD